MVINAALAMLRYIQNVAWMFLKEFGKNFKNTFLTGLDRNCFWYLENVTFKILVLNKLFYAINIVGYIQDH